MRLVAYRARQGGQRIGALVDGDASIVDFRTAAAAGGQGEEAFLDLLALIDGGARALDTARAIVAADAALSER
jgi:hypothetical protein